MGLDEILAKFSELEPVLGSKLNFSMILAGLKLYSDYKADAKDGLSTKEVFALVNELLALLVKAGITVEDLQKIVALFAK